LKVDEKIIAERRKAWKQPALKASKGILFKYAQSVKSADQGCVTDEL
jgi:dihydroxy-acid dehydratase